MESLSADETAVAVKQPALVLGLLPSLSPILPCYLAQVR